MAIKRPMRGVFLGAHAFLNVLSLYYRVRERVPELSQPADYYFRALAPQVYQAINEMTRGDLTDAGQQFQAVLRRHYEELVA
jgi:HEXXH motif-containing protein